MNNYLKVVSNENIEIKLCKKNDFGYKVILVLKYLEDIEEWLKAPINFSYYQTLQEARDAANKAWRDLH